MATAVIDIGKSNAKLALVDDAGTTLRVLSAANAVVADGPYPHYDVDRLWAWIVAGLRAFAAANDVATISVTTHGACFALLAGDDLALPVLDYEYGGPEGLRAEYAKVRGTFAETLSPDLPNGLNAGRQIHWQSRTFPAAFARVDAIVPYPQYWVWRLTGARVTEVTSLGSHTDMWNPRECTYSTLARREGWDRLFRPLAKAWDDAGTILPSVAAATGLAPATRVVAGIHDSNASLWPHLLTRTQPFAVLSTGTWMVVFAPGGSLAGLDPARDCLANVDPLGRPVPSARFMAGREYETIAGRDGIAATPADIACIVGEGIMALPTFAPGTGPFPHSAGRWSHDPARLSAGERAGVASLYAALIAETCLALTGAAGPVIVEGPFARNAVFLRALAQRIARPVIGHDDPTGTIHGAALLAGGPRPVAAMPPDPPPAPPLDVDLAAYAADWLGRAG